MDQTPPGFPREVGACPLPCGVRGPCAHPRPEGLRGQDRVSGAGGPGVGAAPVHSREGSPRRALCRQRLRSLLAPPLGTARVPLPSHTTRSGSICPQAAAKRAQTRPATPLFEPRPFRTPARSGSAPPRPRPFQPISRLPFSHTP